MEPFIELDSAGFSEEEYRDIKLCLETLLSVRAGEQPLDRDFGINYDGITGYPVPVAENTLSVEIIDKVRRYEPRVQVTNVEYESNTEGLLVPRIHCIKANSEV